MKEIIELIPTWNEFVEFIKQQMSTNQFFQTAGFFGTIGVVLQYMKTVPVYLYSRISRLIIYRVTIEDTDEIHDYFEFWLSKHKQNSYRNILAKTSFDYDPDKDKFVSTLKFNHLNDLLFIFKYGNIIKVYKERERLDNANNKGNAYLNRFELASIFSKRAINKLLDQIMLEYIEHEEQNTSDKVKIYNVDNSGFWESTSEVVAKDINNIFMENKQDLLSDIDSFINSRDWYKSRSILYKRGIMLYGPPGNGKTSLCLSIAKKYNRDLYMLDLSKVTSSSLQTAFNDLMPNSILIIEDIDAFFNKRDQKKETTFSFSTLLNCLDGVYSTEDVIVIFTTNHPENLDDAIKRSGRIDYSFYIDNPNTNTINQYLKYFYKTPTNISINSKQTVSMSKIQDICIKNKHNKINAIKYIKSII